MTSLYKPGIHSGIPAEVYHSLPRVSNSYLSRLDKCPAAAKVPQETTDAMRLGSAAHCLTLEGETAFLAQYVVMPSDAPKRPTQRQVHARKPSAETLEAIRFWQEFDRANSDRTPVAADDYVTIIAMAEAVHAHPFAAKLLEAGSAEQSVFWTDPDTGIQMKCRTDWMTKSGGVVVDLKTTTDASEHSFTRSITSFGYHRQAALYLDGVQQFAPQFDAFAFIAVEKVVPYRVEVYTLSPDFIEAGRRDYRRLLAEEIRCRTNGYPAFINPGVTELFKPAWL